IELWERRTPKEGYDDLVQTFRAVGPDAAPAVPMLLQRLAAADPYRGAKDPALALHAIGPSLRPHLPQLAEIARSTIHAIRPWILWVLDGVARDADLNEFLPLMLEVLNNPAGSVSYELDSVWVALRVLTIQAPLLRPEDPRLVCLV